MLALQGTRNTKAPPGTSLTQDPGAHAHVHALKTALQYLLEQALDDRGVLAVLLDSCAGDLGSAPAEERGDALQLDSRMDARPVAWLPRVLGAHQRRVDEDKLFVLSSLGDSSIHYGSCVDAVRAP